MKVYISKVTLNNFKSYYGKVEVAVDSAFVCIVGKNGSGKSAFMDALCWVFGFRSQSLRSENMGQLINDRAKSEGIQRAQVEVQFTLKDIKVPSSINSLEQIVDYLKSPAIALNAMTSIVIGRRINHSSTEYFCTVNDSAYKTIRYSDIKNLLSSLSIQLNTKGKFIIQQSSLLLSLHQKSTTLLEIIEESIGNTKLIDECSNLQTRKKDLETQKDCLNTRIQEIENYKQNHENEYLKNLKRVEVEQELIDSEKHLNQLQKRKLTLENMLKQLDIEKKSEQINQLKEDLQRRTVEMDTIDEEKEKKVDRLKELNKEWCKINEVKETIEGTLKDIRDSIQEKQERLILNVDKQKELLMNEVDTDYIEGDEVYLEYKNEIMQYFQLKKELALISEKKQNCKRKKQEVLNEIIQKRELLSEETLQVVDKDRHFTEYQTVERLVIELRDRLDCSTPVLTHPKQSIIDQYLKQHDPDETPILLASLPIQIQNSIYSRAVHTVCQSSLKDTVVVSERSTAISFIEFCRQFPGVMRCVILQEVEKKKSNRHPFLPRLIDVLDIPSLYQPIFEKLFGNWLICKTEDEAIQVQRESTRWNCVTHQGILFYSKGEVRREREGKLFYFFKVQGEQRLTEIEKQQTKQLLEENETKLRRIEMSVREMEEKERKWNEQQQLRSQIQLLEKHCSSIESEEHWYEMKEKQLLEQTEKLEVPDGIEDEACLDVFRREEIRRKNETIRRKIEVLKEEERNGIAELDSLEQQMKQMKQEKKKQVNHKQMETLQKQRDAIEKEVNELIVRKRQKHLQSLKLESKLETTEKILRELQAGLMSSESNTMSRSRKELEKELKKVRNEYNSQSQKTIELRTMQDALAQQIDSDVIDRLCREETEQTEVNSILSVVEQDLNTCSVINPTLFDTIDSLEKERS